MNRKFLGIFAIVLVAGIAGSGGFYAYEKHKQQQAFEALMQDCGECSNRHSAHLRNKAWKEQLELSEQNSETANMSN